MLFLHWGLPIIDKAPELSGNDNKAEVNHEKGANDDEHDKVDPVPERMSVLCKIFFLGSAPTQAPPQICMYYTSLSEDHQSIILKKKKPAQST